MSGGIVDTDDTGERFFLPTYRRASLTQGTPGSCNFAREAFGIAIIANTFDHMLGLMTATCEEDGKIYIKCIFEYCRFQVFLFAVLKQNKGKTFSLNHFLYLPQRGLEMEKEELLDLNMGKGHFPSVLICNKKILRQFCNSLQVKQCKRYLFMQCAILRFVNYKIIPFFHQNKQEYCEENMDKITRTTKTAMIGRTTKIDMHVLVVSMRPSQNGFRRVATTSTTAFSCLSLFQQIQV